MTRIERFGWRGSPEPGIGRVVSAHGDYYHLVCNDAEGEILARKKKSAFLGSDAVMPITGDFVRFRHNAQGESMITAVEPRWSRFERRDPTARRKAQTLAVNFDSLLLMMSLNENFSTARVERFLDLAADVGEAEVLVVVTKMDLFEDGDEAFLGELEDAVGGRARVMRISALTGEGRGDGRGRGAGAAGAHACTHRKFGRRQVHARERPCRRGVDGDGGDTGVERKGPPHDHEPRACDAALRGYGRGHAGNTRNRPRRRGGRGAREGRVHPPLQTLNAPPHHHILIRQAPLISLV